MFIKRNNLFILTFSKCVGRNTMELRRKKTVFVWLSAIFDAFFQLRIFFLIFSNEITRSNMYMYIVHTQNIFNIMPSFFHLQISMVRSELMNGLNAIYQNQYSSKCFRNASTMIVSHKQAPLIISINYFLISIRNAWRKDLDVFVFVVGRVKPSQSVTKCKGRWH